MGSSVDTGTGFSGLLGNAAAGRWGRGDDVVFIHTRFSRRVHDRPIALTRSRSAPPSLALLR
jgi:hypothetical protein